MEVSSRLPHFFLQALASARSLVSCELLLFRFWCTSVYFQTFAAAPSGKQGKSRSPRLPCLSVFPSTVGWPSGLLWLAVDTARLIRPSGQPLLLNLYPSDPRCLHIPHILYSSCGTLSRPALLRSGEYADVNCLTYARRLPKTQGKVSSPRLSC